MDDNRFPPEGAEPPHLSIDRHVTVGDTQFLITASGHGSRRIDLAVVACDREGRVVSELSGGISPADLPSVAGVVSATLSGLVALHTMSTADRTAHSMIPGDPALYAMPPADPTLHTVAPGAATTRRSRNHGARWSPDDDTRLIERHRGGATQRELMEEFGRTRGGIRARLVHLGELTEDGTAAA